VSALLERFTGLTLRDPAFLWLALPVAAALALGLRRPPVVVFAHASVLDQGPGPTPPRTARAALLPLPRALQAVGLLLVAFALARPAERVLEPLEAEGSDVVLCLDTSSSMTADDLAERRSRLDVAKAAAADFVRARPDDRIGLVAFARYPDLLCPPTLDHGALARILEELEPVVGDGPEDATGIGAAVAQATQVLEPSAAQSKVVVVLTDGEENVALAGAKGEIAPAHAAQWAKRSGVYV
jgi:Ca-activated chloride channel homolog